VRGTVRAVKPFGVFVSLDGGGAHRPHHPGPPSALVHHTHVSDGLAFSRDDDAELREKALAFVAPVGEPVYVKILDVRPDPGAGGFRVQASMRLADQVTGEDLDPTGSKAAQIGCGGGGGGGGGSAAAARGAAAIPSSASLPKEGDILRATVKRVEPYGAFVALPGLQRRLALVHLSELSDHMPRFAAEDGPDARREAVAGVVAIGDEVWVKVVEVAEGGGRAAGDDDDGDGGVAAGGAGGGGGGAGQQRPQQLRVSCSMRLVSQSDGADLDADGSVYARRARKKGGGDGGHAKEQQANARQHGGVGAVRAGGVIDWAHERGSVKTYAAVAEGGADEDAAAAAAAAAGGSRYALLGEEEEEATGEVAPAAAAAVAAQTVVVDDPEARALGISSIEEAMAVLRAAEEKKRCESRRRRSRSRSRERGRERSSGDRDRGKKRRSRSLSRSRSRSRSRNRSRERDRKRSSGSGKKRRERSRSRSRERGRRRR
jgi:predicted RNA-binding protein with RPS1 domain